MLILSLTALLFAACKKKDAASPDDVDASRYVNDWIYTNMKHYYYWTTSIPSNPDGTQNPAAFFENLLKLPDDQYSWIENNFEDLLASLNGIQKEAGYGYSLFLHTQGNALGAQVTYVKKGSPAEAAGLKRGDLFFQINGKTFPYSDVNASKNLNDFVAALGENHSLNVQQYFTAANGDDSLGTARIVNLSTVVFAENPVYLDSVYTIDGKKIGYFMYNFFAVDKGDSSFTYNKQVDAVFNKFKAAGVQHLILDLRYNPGGEQEATVNLGSQIVKSYAPNKLFFRREYNSTYAAELTKAFGADYLKINFLDKAGNIGNSLQNFIVLTSHETASASELIINGLKPYMNVYIIGDSTAGKNVGSTTLYEENDRRNKWGMQPIITKAFNSEGRSDYGRVGFKPDEQYVETFHLGTLGDTKEPLLHMAMKKILGAQWERRVPMPRTAPTRVDRVGSSNMTRAFYQKMIEPRPKL